MTGYSFNRVRTAALKSIAAMQDRLENIAADFGDVDMFLVGEAEQCRDRLAATLKLDMATWFTPTAENYFARVSKTGILEALKEAKGDIAPAWNTARKGDLAAIAERQLAETGWLPTLLRKAA
jgi:hypothetical protein